MVERWFGELTTKKIKRGAHTNVPNLEKDIREWIALWNENPRPYVWVKTADQISSPSPATASESPPRLPHRELPPAPATISTTN